MYVFRNFTRSPEDTMIPMLPNTSSCGYFWVMFLRRSQEMCHLYLLPCGLIGDSLLKKHLVSFFLVNLEFQVGWGLIYRFCMYSLGYIDAQTHAQSVVPDRAPSCHHKEYSGHFSIFYMDINICHGGHSVNILSLLQRAQQQLPHRTAPCTSKPQGR